MGSHSEGNIFLTIIKTILLFTVKAVAIVAAFALQLCGQVILKIGEGIEKMCIK